MISLKRLLLLLVLCWQSLAALAQTASPAAAAGSAQERLALRVALDDNYPPYIFRGADGQLQGVLVDVWALWQQRTGRAVELLASDWAVAQQRMATGQVEVIDTIFETSERLQTLDFTAPYARIEVPIYFHQTISGIVDTASLRGFSVAVKEGDACVDLLQANNVTQLRTYPSYSDIINAAAVGAVRVFCMDAPPAGYLLNQRRLADEFRHSPAISVGQFHRGVRKGNAPLLAELQAGFAKITVAEYQAINDKWLGTGVASDDISQAGRWAGYSLLAATLMMLVLGLWNFTLRRRVREQTQAQADALATLEHTKRVLEQALAEQKTMLDNEMVGIVKVRERVVVWANRAFEKLFGYEPGEMAGTPTSQYYRSIEDYLHVTTDAYPLMAQGQVYRAQTEFVRRDGQSVWVELSGAMLAGQSGESLWAFLDITERRRLSQSRDDALVHLQKLTDRVPGLVYQYLLRPDGSSRFPFASDWIRQIYHISPAEAQVDASGAFGAIHPDDQIAVATSIQQSALKLTPWQHEYRARFADGSIRWLYGNSLPERLDDGSVQWYGFITDITERKAADERLRQLSRSVEQAPLAIVITDLAGHILYANPRFSLNTGYTLEEAMGKNPRILKSGLTPPERYVELWDTLGRGEVWKGELHNRRKNGELFIEHAVIAPVQDASGNTSHYVAVKEDITARKQADEALQASLQEKVALLNEVHHRVKNNLQVVSSLLRLEAGRSAEPGTRAVLKEMQGRILAMALLHETLYRVGSFAAVELGAYLRQLASQTFRAQSSQTSAVRLQLEVAAVQVVLDQATPCGLLVNELISNCLKHAFPEGRSGLVLVRSVPGESAGQWLLEVSDDGVGLPADFDVRSQKSLGLQLVGDLAHQLGGTLQVSRAGGATFSVVFALEAVKPVAPIKA